MTHSEILTKAIEKAIAGGWDGKYNFVSSRSWSLPELAQWLLETDHVYYVIFSHEFTKALWPGNMKMHKAYQGVELPLWKGHLQLMVIADDPIAYFGEHI